MPKSTSKSKSKSNPKTKKTREAESNLVNRHLGIIAKHCGRFWRLLPAETRAFYDVEDMISDVVIHVLRRSQQYDASIAKESTWVWHIAENRCKSIVGHYQTKQYTACKTVELTTEVKDSIHYSTRRESEAKSAVERMIQYGSDEVRDFLDRLFNSKRITIIPVYELQTLAKQYSVTLTDLMIVLRRVVS